MKFEGGCYCGDIRYEVTSEPKVKSQCHCRECQHISGGGPNYYMLIAAEGFKYTKGEPNTFTRKDLEKPVTRQFCGTCATPIATRIPGFDMVILKAGSLDDPSLFGKSGSAIYTCDAQPFHHIPEGIPSFDKVPKR